MWRTISKIQMKILSLLSEYLRIDPFKKVYFVVTIDHIVNEYAVFARCLLINTSSMSGNNTEAVPNGQYEAFPVALAIVCIIMILAMMLLFTVVFLYRSCWKNVNTRQVSSQEEGRMPSAPAVELRGESKDFASDIEQVIRFEEHDDRWEDNAIAPCRPLKDPKTLMQWKNISCSYKVKNKKTTILAGLRSKASQSNADILIMKVISLHYQKALVY